MTEPIRYSINDPIEKWQFDALLLDAEPADLNEKDLEYIEKMDLSYVIYDPAYLFSPEGEEELRQLFGIYVLAHYRNEPDDLGIIADAPHHIIRAVKIPSNKIVCALQIAYEGPIDHETAKELLKGGKIPGNIIPDRFLKHNRLVEFADTRGWRIVRIATHPQVQGRGIGTWALNKVISEARSKNLDWVGAGFGVNEQLLRFWIKTGFLPVHISPDRNPVSGEYTVLVVHPLSEKTKKLISIANKEFKLKIIESLTINYNDLELGVAKIFLDHGPSYVIDKDSAKSLFSNIGIERLWIYCLGPMTFEAAADLMYRLAKVYWLLPKECRPNLQQIDEYLLIAKILQGRSWEGVAEELHLKKGAVIERVRSLACIFLEELLDIGRDYEPGIHLKDLKTTKLFL